MSDLEMPIMMSLGQEEQIKLRKNIFGYDTLCIKPIVVGISGDNVPTLRIGMQVRISKDIDIIKKNFFQRIVTIIGFVEPFEDDKTSNIIIVTNGYEDLPVKPSEVELISTSNDIT
jgi:hypothetical protein